MTRILFLQYVYEQWAKVFTCSHTVFTQPGTTVLPSAPSADRYPLQLWRIGYHAFLYVHPYVASQFALEPWSPHDTLSAPRLLQLVRSMSCVTASTRQLTYVYPPDLPPLHHLTVPHVRLLNSDDAPALCTLQAAATPQDVHVSNVQLTHPLAVGAFMNERLVAAASTSESNGFFDVGVLTHPAVRGCGLGGTVVHSLCTQALEQNQIVQYCYNIMNTSSQRIATRLKFMSAGQHIRLRIQAERRLLL